MRTDAGIIMHIARAARHRAYPDLAGSPRIGVCRRDAAVLVAGVDQPDLLAPREAL